MTAAFMNPISTQTWTNGRHAVRCVKVIQETWDVRTFCFAAVTPVVFFFKPGQFVTLELEIDREQVMRSYTISSSPSVPYSFSITVKRVPGGRISNWLHDTLKKGDEIVVHGPVGNFNCIDFPAEKVLLLSGGVGITPLMSMARWCFDTNSEVDMVFVHSARTPKDIVYRRELEHMDSRIPNFDLSIICEGYEVGETWSGYTGFLNEPMLQLIASDYHQREIFCCGPAPYMSAVREFLARSGYAMERYHEESFGVSPAGVEVGIEAGGAVVDVAPPADTAEQYSVEFTKTGKNATIAPGETVHEAAAKVGLHIPKACGMGICGTCKVRKTSGEVVMKHNGGITDSDVEAGYILSCCSEPQGDVSVEF
jgi:glycine betaine monooxygenase B